MGRGCTRGGHGDLLHLCNEEEDGVGGDHDHADGDHDDHDDRGSRRVEARVHEGKTRGSFAQYAMMMIRRIISMRMGTIW